MKNNKQILSSMVRTTRMGQTGIRAVLSCDLEPELKTALSQQLREYDALEEKAQSLAAERNWTLKNKDAFLQHMIQKMTRMKLGKKNRTTKIADMVIQGNTQGMISSLRDMHQYHGKDHRVIDLNQELVYCEVENIRQMKPFL